MQRWEQIGYVMKAILVIRGIENERLLLMLLLINTTVKCELVFFLTQENPSSWRFYFKASKKTLGSSKNGRMNF